jgi:N-ethylmaleimide reductase
MLITRTDRTGSESQPLFAPGNLGGLALRNRIAMAPMTRARADNAALTPTPLHRKYYQQRAGAGLIVSEGAWISQDAIGSAHVPGMFSGEQVTAWGQVTEAVHAAGGVIFAQLAHSGAYAHPDFRICRSVAGPSAVNVGGKVLGSGGLAGGFTDTPTPRALTRGEIRGVVEDFRRAAVNARLAGFDGVELHAHRWYLLAEFLSPWLNLRTDEFGGSVGNRARLVFEVLDAVVDGFGPNRVGIKLAPFLPALDGSDVTAQMWPSYDHVLRGLADRPLAYLHLMGPQSRKGAELTAEERLWALRPVRDIYPGALIANGGFDRSTANAALAAGLADLVSFGGPFIANPDLPARFFTKHVLAVSDPATIYGGGAEGYVDYPPAGQPADAPAIEGAS